MAADLTVVAQISNIVAALLWIPYYVSSNADGIYAVRIWLSMEHCASKRMQILCFKESFHLMQKLK